MVFVSVRKALQFDLYDSAIGDFTLIHVICKGTSANNEFPT